MTIFGKQIESIKDFFSREDPIKYIEIPLGKFSEAVKSEKQMKGYSNAQEAFDKNEWPKYILGCLDYVFDDKHIKGSYKNEEGDNWDFAGAHGSMIFHGRISPDFVEVQAILMRIGNSKPSMLRQLLEASLEYDFISFGINDDNEILITFYISKAECNVDLFIEAMKELCLTGDVTDSKISVNYPSSKWTNQDRVIYDPDSIRDLKYELYTSELALVKDYMTMNLKKSVGVDPIKISYRLLGFFYKMDYLISPRNYLFGYYINAVQSFWYTMNQSQNNFELGIEELRKQIEDIPDMDKEIFTNEAINLPYLFSTREEFNLQALKNNFSAHIDNLKKYKAEGEDEALYWCMQVLLGFLIFHMDLDENWTEWVCYLYALLDPRYFNDYGFLGNILTEDDSNVNLDLMHNKLEEIIKQSSQSINPLPPLPEKAKMETGVDTVFSILLSLS